MHQICFADHCNTLFRVKVRKYAKEGVFYFNNVQRFWEHTKKTLHVLIVELL